LKQSFPDNSSYQSYKAPSKLIPTAITKRSESNWTKVMRTNKYTCELVRFQIDDFNMNRTQDLDHYRQNTNFSG
jgi:hypothetical protein